MATALKAPIHKNRTTTMSRINNSYNPESVFSDINLSSQIYSESVEFDSLEVFSILGPHGSWQQYKFEDILAAEYVPAKIGDSFGPTWTTHWFRVRMTIPSSWVGKEVHLRWMTGSENAIYNEAGHVLQGFAPGSREEYIISTNWQGEQPNIFYIEMACSRVNGAGDKVPGHSSDILPTNENLFWTLSTAEIAVFNRAKFNIKNDLELLYQTANKLGEGNHIGMQAMFAANEMVNWLRLGNDEQAAEVSNRFFSHKQGDKVHTIYALGHCHIDTAWLWPYDETIRKCARSFSSQMRLMEEYHDFRFVCSSAQQYAWVKQWYPSLYEEIREQITSGKFIPVGASWIENDGYVPSGESFIRQFFYGQKFFQREFNVTCKEFWLPDTFGYSAQLPQIIKHCGIERFLTQKMSWNLVNRFPNNSFIWEGIDGTQVLTHFPPGDNYNMQNSVDDFINTQNNSSDKGRTNVGLQLFGNGDGGGGPTRTMLERLNRIKETDGYPRVLMTSPNDFFERLEEDKEKLYKWVGELYLELHNGTYTSQSKIKWYNRKCEFLLREVELQMAIAYASGRVTEGQKNIDMATVDRNWENVLLNQFHDVLPGSCIEAVTKDAWKIYEDVFNSLTGLRAIYNSRIVGEGSNFALFNPLPWQTKMVVFMKPDDFEPPEGEHIQQVELDTEPFEDDGQGRFRVPNNFAAALVDLRPNGYTLFEAESPGNPVSFLGGETGGVFSNGIVSVEFTSVSGQPRENIKLGNKPIFRDPLGNSGVPQFFIFDDYPMYWDAWDIPDFHLETRREPDFEEDEMRVIARGDIVGCYKWSAKFGASEITRYTIIRADLPMIEYYTIVDWKENRKLLKVEFPLDILGREATYEIQYGHIQRPTHINTSWDMAKYEVCGHKWVDLSQADWGVTIITDCKYGFHARDNVIQVSLLKSPKAPDGNCDMHKHFIYYAVLPHQGSFQEAEVIRRSYELNLLGSNNVPVLPTNMNGATLPANWVTTNNSAVVIEAVKVCEEVSRAIIVRLYEGNGGSSSVIITLGFPITKVTECSGLEEPIEDVPHNNNTFNASFRPFQIKSFMVSF